VCGPYIVSLFLLTSSDHTRWDAKGVFGSLLCSAWLDSWEPGSHGPAASKPGSTEMSSSFVSRERGWVLISAREGTNPTEMQSTNRCLVAHSEPTYQCCSQPNHHEVHAPSLVRPYTSKQTHPKLLTSNNHTHAKDDCNLVHSFSLQLLFSSQQREIQLLFELKSYIRNFFLYFRLWHELYR
jgi:hypothetical protein